MAITLHANNAFGYLLTPVAPSDTTIVLQSGQGALFPSIVPGEQFYVTVENRAIAGAMEIMLCTARTLDSMIVIRAQQGTTAKSFAAGDSVSNRVTAAFLNDFDARIGEAGATADAAAIAAASALATANSALSGLALKANLAGPTTFTGVISAPTAAPGTNTTQLATTAFVTAAVLAGGGGGGGGAPVDSPIFTGNPTAPTAPPGDNDLTLANTAFVTAAVATGVSGLAPLADPHFSGVPTTPLAAAGTNTDQIASTKFVTTALADKADLASPAFSGAPTALTAAPGTNSLQLANTAFVTAAIAVAIAGGGGGMSELADDTSPTLGGNLDPGAFHIIGMVPEVDLERYAAPGLTTQYWRGDKSWQTLNKAAVGLSSVDNTSDVDKPVSTAQAAALALKAALASPTFSGNPTTPTQVAADNSLRLANTQYVTTAVASRIGFTSPPAALSIPIVGTDGKVTTWSPYTASVVPPSAFLVTNTADPAEIYGATAAQHAALMVGATVAGNIIGIGTNNGPFVQLTPTQQTANILAASLTVSGRVEIATPTEINTGTDTGRVPSVDTLAESIFGIKEVGICVFESDESVTVGDGTQGIPIPHTMNGMDILGVRACVHTKGVTGATDVQVRRRRGGTNTDVLSTKVTLGDEWTVSDGVINAANDDLATGDMLFVDVDAVHTTAPLGLSVVITARLP